MRCLAQSALGIDPESQERDNDRSIEAMGERVSELRRVSQPRFTESQIIYAAVLDLISDPDKLTADPWNKV